MKQFGLMKDLDKRMKFSLGQPATMMLAMGNDGKFMTEIQDDGKSPPKRKNTKAVKLNLDDMSMMSGDSSWGTDSSLDRNEAFQDEEHNKLLERNMMIKSMI